MTMMNPWLSGRYAFDECYVITRADSRLQLTAMISKAVRDFHLTRIGVMWSSGIGTAEEKVSESREILDRLGLPLTAAFPVPINSSSTDWKGPGYDAFLATRPQAILVFCVVTISCGFALFDIVSKASTTTLVDPHVKLFLWDQQVQVVKDLLNTAHLLRFRFDPGKQLFVTLANPLATDDRYLASQHALQDLADYFGNWSFMNNGAGYLYSAMTSWIAAQTFIEAVRDMQPSNLTAAAFRDKIFDSSSFSVDDLLIGMFSGRCVGEREALDLQCECNVGYGVVEMYQATNSTWMDPVPGGLETSLADCGGVNRGVFVQSPLVLLAAAVNQSDPDTMAISNELLAGLRAFENATSPSAIASMEPLVLGNGTDAAAMSAAVSHAVANLYLSAAFGSVLDPAETAVATLPLVDPISVPAALTPPFQENILYISATLEQELYAIAQFVATRLRLPAGALVRGAHADNVIDVISRSLNTFGVAMGPSVALPVTASFAVTAPCTQCVLFVLGVASTSDVAYIGSLLRTHRQLQVVLSFSEFSAFYDKFLTTLRDAEARVWFASSVPNWNAPNLTQSPVMASFFSQFPSRSQRTPLALRGFYAAAALHAVVSHVSGPLLASSLLSVWYAVSVVSMSAVDYVGAYSNATCFSTADVYCKTNVGARKLYVMSVADVSATSALPLDYASTTFFPSGSLVYIPLATSPYQLSSATIAGIAIASAALVMVLVAACWRFLPRGRDNTFAPKDCAVPVTLLFTDIQSSTALWATAPDAMAPALETHHRLIRELIRKHRCYEVKTIGDAFMIATGDAAAAVKLAFELQHVFYNHDWGTGEFDDAYRTLEIEKCAVGALPISAALPSEAYRLAWNGIRVRVGVHTGIAEIKFDSTTKGYDYYGTVSNVAARTESAGHGGQVLITQATLDAIGPTVAESYVITSQGPTELKGVPEPVVLYNLATVPTRSFSRITIEPQAPAVPAWAQADSPTAASSSTRSSSPNVLLSARSLQYNPPSDPLWQDALVHFMALLFSRTAPSFKHNAFDVISQGWHAQPLAGRRAAHTARVKDDPYVIAIASMLSPYMSHRFGRLQGGVLPFSGEWNSTSFADKAPVETSPHRAASPPPAM